MGASVASGLIHLVAACGGAGEIYKAACALLVICGLARWAYTVGHVTARTSGANTKGRAVDSLTTTGIYSAIGNPLYLARRSAMWA